MRRDLIPVWKRCSPTFMQAIGIYEYSEDGLELIEVNNAFYELFGWEDRALHSDNLMEVVRPEDRQCLWKRSDGQQEPRERRSASMTAAQ